MFGQEAVHLLHGARHELLPRGHLVLSRVEEVGEVLQGSVVLSLQRQVLVEPAPPRAHRQNQLLIGILWKPNLNHVQDLECVFVCMLVCVCVLLHTERERDKETDSISHECVYLCRTCNLSSWLVVAWSGCSWAPLTFSSVSLCSNSRKISSASATIYTQTTHKSDAYLCVCPPCAKSVCVYVCLWVCVCL